MSFCRIVTFEDFMKWVVRWIYVKLRDLHVIDFTLLGVGAFYEIHFRWS